MRVELVVDLEHEHDYRKRTMSTQVFPPHFWDTHGRFLDPSYRFLPASSTKASEEMVWRM
jgi:hypothetical protein